VFDQNFYQMHEGGMMSSDKTKIYFFGIIDILTEYSTRKKLEHSFKKIRYDNTISCVPPQRYAERFADFQANALVD